MCIHEYALLLRVHIIIPVLLIKDSVIMRIREYTLVRICINALLRIFINASQTVQGHHPDRICILFHGAQPICIIFMNTHYNGFLRALWKLTEHCTRSLKTESEKNSPLVLVTTTRCQYQGSRPSSEQEQVSSDDCEYQGRGGGGSRGLMSRDKGRGTGP